MDESEREQDDTMASIVGGAHEYTRAPLGYSPLLAALSKHFETYGGLTEARPLSEPQREDL